jgi:NitT/TauT family transport system substrate-binding protein
MIRATMLTLHNERSRGLDMTRTLALAAALTTATGAAAAQELTEVSFGTNWYPQAEHGGYYQAMVDGTYEACGLDVTIVPGGPQVNNRALLFANRIQFHMGGNLLQAFTAVEQGIPLVVVAAHFQKDPQVLLSHPGEGLDTWESLQDPEITLFIGENGFQSYYQWMMDVFDFTAAQREVYTFNPAPFLADPRSAQQGYLTSEPFAIEQTGGFTPNVFLIADQGWNTYSTTVETMRDFLEENPEAVECFVDGSATGWVNYLYGDRSAANAAIMEANPEMTQEQLDYSVSKLKEYGIVDSGDTNELGIGAMTAERFASFYDKMVAAGVLPAGIEPTDVYTLEFVNEGVGLDLETELAGN